MPSVRPKGVEVKVTLHIRTENGSGVFQTTAPVAASRALTLESDAAGPEELAAELEAHLEELGWTWDDR